MATYKEIKGVTVQTRDTDPVIGGVAGGTWSTGGTLNSDRESWAGVSGTRDASITFGGYPGSPSNANTEKYDGTSWTEVNELNEGRHGNTGSVNGSQTATLCFGGTSPVTTDNESWNGTNWTEVGELNTARFYAMGAGTSTAALGFGGNTPSITDSNESWSGSSWTEVNELNNGRGYGGSAGTSTAAIAMGGDDGSTRAYTEIWNGTSWSEESDLNTTRYGVGGAGTSTDALCFAGYPTGAINEHWNGSSWTEVADLGTARGYTTGHGATSGAAICLSGTPGPGNYRISEEFAIAPVTSAILTEGSMFLSGTTSLKVFGKAAGLPAGAWSSQTNINTARGLGAGCGTQDSALIYGGFTNPPSVTYAQTEEWNGSAWTEKGDLNVPFYYIDAGGLGTVTAALAHGGEGPSGGTGGETFNGSSWTEITNSNSNHIKAGGAGSSTAGLSIASYPPTSPNEQVEEWNGSAWTEIADVNEGRGDGAGSGTSISAWWCGGEAPGNSAKTEVWDGTTWTESGDLNTARYAHRGSGANQNDGLVYGGPVPTGDAAKTELWNGSTWTEISDLATARQNIQSSAGNASGSVSALASGGYNAGTNAVEEFVVDNTLSTVTVS